MYLRWAYFLLARSRTRFARPRRDLPSRQCRTAMSENAALLLMKQLKELKKHPVEGFSAGLKDDDNPFVWEIMIMGPPDTPGAHTQATRHTHTDAEIPAPRVRPLNRVVGRASADEGGFFQAEMVFPHEYPNHPPKLKFTSDFYHPNVYTDGTVCISILHPPGGDAPAIDHTSRR